MIYYFIIEDPLNLYLQKNFHRLALPIRTIHKYLISVFDVYTKIETFSPEDGSYITARTMQHTSSIIHHNLTFSEFDYHSLRHTHATMLSEQGAPLQYIQKRLGHKKEKVTTEVYTNHLTDAIKQQGNNILNAMF